MNVFRLACSRLLLRLGLLAIAGAPLLHARIDLLLVPPGSDTVAIQGLTLTLYLNNPTDRSDRIVLPAQLEADYASGDYHGRALFRLVESQPAQGFVIGQGDFRTVQVRLDSTLKAEGRVVSLRFTNPATNAIMFAQAAPPVTAASPVAQAPQAKSPRPSGRWLVGEHLDLTSDLENMRRHVSAYDPIYFAVGWRERFNARFQFSFKFRVFEDRGEDYPEPWLKKRFRELHFAYTQTSIWDLESFSKPFYDSSYKPTVFLLQKLPTFRPDVRVTLQSGAQHESNGKGGGSAPAIPTGGLISSATRTKHPFDTRSLNTLYVMPRVRWEPTEGGFLEGAARLSGYFQHDENDDIEQYRGNVELTVRGGLDRGPQLSMHLRGRPDGHGSVEFNLTWPANQTPFLKDLAPSLGGYAQIQYFNGYGESLLDYDVRRRDQLRFGLMIVR